MSNCWIGKAHRALAMLLALRTSSHVLEGELRLMYKPEFVSTRE